MNTVTKPRILIISSAESSENMQLNNNFVTHLNEHLQGDFVEWQNYHNIGLRMDSNGLEAFLVSSGRSLSDYSAVYFKSIFRYHEQATSIAEALAHNNVHFIGSELKHYIPAYKLSQLSRLARAGLAIPKTLYLPLEHYASHYDQLTKELGSSFIFKAIDGSTGENNYFIHSKEELDAAVRDNPDLHFIAQAFIANESDLRVIMLEDKVMMVIERRRADNTTHLNNTSQGAAASLVDKETVDSEILRVAAQAAKLMHRDVAGVDVMVETGTGVPYILEVNASPQIASGAFEEEKLDAFAEYFRGLL